MGQLSSKADNYRHPGANCEISPTAFKQQYVTKAFKNLSLVHEKKEADLDRQMHSKYQISNDYQIYRPLYKKFFNENAHHYMEAIKDPLNPKYRQLLIQSDLEFGKLVKDYAEKEKKHHEKLAAKENHHVQNQLGEYIKGGISNFGFRKRIPKVEKIYSQQLEDLDNYTSENMIQNLQQFDNGDEQKLGAHKKEVKRGKSLCSLKEIYVAKPMAQPQKGKRAPGQNKSTSDQEVFERKILDQKKSGFFIIRRN